ncbi:MAG: 50S ribosomal protein L9 [Kiritimatiellia bacterium]
MPKKLILLNDVEGLGIIGDVVTVADGHARNFLLPKGHAQPVSDRLIEKLADARAEREAELREAKAGAEAFAEKVKATSITLSVKTSAEGRLYGSVAAAEIAEEANKKGLKIDTKQVHLGAPIRQLGSYEVRIRLHPEVAADLKVEVVADEEA